MQEQKTEYGWQKGKGISLLDKLQADLKHAMKNRDEAGKLAIRQIMGEFPGLTVPITLESGKKSFRVKSKDEITDDDILGIVGKLVKAEKTVLEAKKSEASTYLNILETYLPPMATGDEIKAWIQANVDFSAYKSPMQAMGQIMKHYGQGADGKLVKEVLQTFTK